MAGSEIIYGVNPVIEALRSGRRRCHEVLIAASRKQAPLTQVEQESARHGVKITRTTREEIGHRVHTDKHQGVAAIVEPYPYAVFEDVAQAAVADDNKAFLLILDGITDPQNLGSIIRTAYLLGVHGVILPRDNAASITPAVVKASAGATEYLPVVQITNIAQSIRYLKKIGMWVAAAAAEGDKSIYDNDFRGLNLVLVLGSEGSGIRRLVRESCDYSLYIPMQGQVLSYNVSAAGALFMGEVARQRREYNAAKTIPEEALLP